MLYKVALQNKSKANASTEVLRGVLINLGFAAQDIVEFAEKNKTGIILYVTKSSVMRKLEDSLKTLRLVRTKMIVDEVKKEQWQNAWKDNVKPFNFTDRFRVIPVWHMSSANCSRREPLYIDTDLAFGTGLHETTRFLGEMIVQRKGQFRSFLDIGTGTGILSIVAHKSLAEAIYALDIDSHAVVKAQKNMKLNGGGFRYIEQIDFRNFNLRIKFDFIAANLNTYDLISIHDKMCKLLKLGGFLAVSGIDLGNLHKIKRVFACCPLRCLSVRIGKKWAAVLYKKI